MPDLAPEAQAREQIDAQLKASGWTLQDYTRYDGSAASAIALREIPVNGGPTIQQRKVAVCRHMDEDRRFRTNRVRPSHSFARMKTV